MRFMVIVKAERKSQKQGLSPTRRCSTVRWGSLTRSW